MQSMSTFGQAMDAASINDTRESIRVMKEYAVVWFTILVWDTVSAEKFSLLLGNWALTDPSRTASSQHYRTSGDTYTAQSGRRSRSCFSSIAITRSRLKLRPCSFSSHPFHPVRKVASSSVLMILRTDTGALTGCMGARRLDTCRKIFWGFATDGIAVMFFCDCIIAIRVYAVYEKSRRISYL